MSMLLYSMVMVSTVLQESPSVSLSTCGVFVRSCGATVFLWLQRTEPHDVNMYLSKVKYDQIEVSQVLLEHEPYYLHLLPSL